MMNQDEVKTSILFARQFIVSGERYLKNMKEAQHSGNPYHAEFPALRGDVKNWSLVLWRQLARMRGHVK